MKFLTIRQTAKEFGIPEFAIRTMQKCGEVPGFYSGSRFYVNAEKFEEKLLAAEESAPKSMREAIGR